MLITVVIIITPILRTGKKKALGSFPARNVLRRLQHPKENPTAAENAKSLLLGFASLVQECFKANNSEITPAKRKASVRKIKQLPRNFFNAFSISVSLSRIVSLGRFQFPV